jgi:hypothetical protein
MSVEKFLLPGDCLLYNSGGLIGWIIKVKTWHSVSHCEGYVGFGLSVASRGPQDGVGGVGKYPLRLDGLAYVLRPIPRFDLRKAMAWFKTVEGQSYDFWGLFKFVQLGLGNPSKMFCSEFLTRWYRAGEMHPFNRSEDADLVSPAQFLQSPEFNWYRVINGEVVYVENPTPVC